MGTDPSDPATLFVKPAGEAAVAEAPKPKVMSDGLFIKKHMPRLVRAPSSSRLRSRYHDHRQPPKAADIQKELAGLVKEFGGYTLCRENKTNLFCNGPYLSVKTDPIVLKDDNGDEHAMGEFEIFLNLGVAQGSRAADYNLIGAFALTPNRADKSDDITHPHVQDNDICFGDGGPAAAKALADCRFVDAFSIVNQILHTYNSESPYAALESWHDYSDGEGSDLDDDDDDSGGSCVDCDEHTEGNCDNCFDHLCDGCAASCTDPGCNGNTYCPGCAAGNSRFVRCADCGTTRPQGRNLCEQHRYYIPETKPPRYRCDHCNARAITDDRPHSNSPGTRDVDPNAPDRDYTPVPPPRPGRRDGGAAPADPPGRSADAHLGFGAPGDDDGLDASGVDLAELGDDHTTRGWGAPAR